MMDGLKSTGYVVPLSPVSNLSEEVNMDSTGTDHDSRIDAGQTSAGGREPPLSSTALPSARALLRQQGRKRAASINTDKANFAQLESLSLDTPVGAGPRSVKARDSICLCVPVPKVPRPRNAFILYRQHHQAQVVADHPGLANPDISKIIGERWREESDAVKNNWKNLAEEEKQCHQRKYPDYRYQPRRNGRAQAGQPGSSTADELLTCARCGGRTIASPRTPTTPFMGPTPTMTRTPSLPVTNTKGPDPDSGYGRRFSQGGVGQGGVGQGGFSQGVVPPSFSTRNGEKEDGCVSPGMDLKRRRLNLPTGSHHQAAAAHTAYPASGYYETRQRQQSVGVLPPTVARYGPNPLVAPYQLSRAGPGSMPPPPPPPTPLPTVFPLGIGNSVHRPSQFDESLRLPPLQDFLPQQQANNNGSDSLGPDRGMTTYSALGLQPPTGRQEEQAQSVAAMVMSIPFMNKLGTLGQICPALPAPRPDSPALEMRGAVIAVEGSSPDLLRQVGAILDKTLRASEADVKIWMEGAAGADLDMETTGGGSHGRGDMQDMFAAYLQTMVGWHERSRQIVQHITTDRQQVLPDGSETAVQPGGSEGGSDREATAGTHQTAAKARTPVALVSDGFSLTISDRYACAVPIADSYAPVDHWQWMATMWRGIVGPDLVVYVRTCAEDEAGLQAAVELRAAGVMVVRVVEGRDLDEKLERRLAFELMEWLRAGSFRETARMRVGEGNRRRGTGRVKGARDMGESGDV